MRAPACRAHHLERMIPPTGMPHLCRHLEIVPLPGLFGVLCLCRLKIFVEVLRIVLTAPGGSPWFDISFGFGLL